MKKFLVCAVMLAFVAACGGSGTPAEPTTPETQAAADAAMTGATGAIVGAISNSEPSSGDMPSGMVKGASLSKSEMTVDLDWTGMEEICPLGGRVVVLGVLHLNCTDAAQSVCTLLADQSATIDFQECAMSVVKDGTTYNVVLDTETEASTTIAGTVTIEAASGEMLEVNLSGALSGIIGLTGDLTGTANLSLVRWGATSTDPTCSGTSEIILTAPEESTEICTVSSSCDGCTI